MEQAKQGNYPKSKDGLKKQVIAAVADNADLTKRLNHSLGETLKYAQENRELKEYKVRAAKAISLLAKLERENPEAVERLISSTAKTSTKANHWSK